MAPFYIIQATLLFIIGVLLPSGTQSVGVCYGRNGYNLPSEQAVIDLYKANRIGRMRLYDPVPAALQALRGTNIEIILDVPNRDLQSLTNPAAAKTWVRNNIQNYFPGVKFRYISVGNEVAPNNGDTYRYVNFVLPAMQNVHDAIVVAGLQNQIKVSTATYSGITADSFPPSSGKFRDDSKGFIEPIIRFLANNNAPLLANIYPYFTLPGNLQYALFTAPGVVVTDPERNRQYSNLFDALLDVMYSAAEKAGGPNIEVVVSESGWPSAGGADASVENARTYYKNLIDHVKSGKGTPKRPGRNIETYLFAMFDENNKGGAQSEKHFGVFNPTTSQQKFQLNFS